MELDEFLIIISIMAFIMLAMMMPVHTVKKETVCKDIKETVCKDIQVTCSCECNNKTMPVYSPIDWYQINSPIDWYQVNYTHINCPSYWQYVKE